MILRSRKINLFSTVLFFLFVSFVSLPFSKGDQQGKWLTVDFAEITTRVLCWTYSNLNRLSRRPSRDPRAVHTGNPKVATYLYIMYIDRYLLYVHIFNP
jgi:hypothetical protein